MTSLSSKVCALTAALFISSSVFATPAGVPVEKPFIPQRMKIELRGRGVSYDTKVIFDYNGQKVTAIYHVEVEWQKFISGDFSLELKDYEMAGKKYSSEGREIHY